jgi:nucleoside-diphosphate-sugar epimerase
MLATILGAGGPIGNDLAKILVAQNARVRLVSRNPKLLDGTVIFKADLADREQTVQAVAGSDVVFLLAGLAYETVVWQELWPRIMANTIEACERANAKLVFFDNVYMYGRVQGPMTEQIPDAPCSKKGAVRAAIARTLMNEVQAGNVSALIARAADFYGPNTKNGVPNVLVFENFAKGATASWLVNADVPHSLTFIPDAARGVAMLAERESAFNQIWHLPTAPNPPTGREFIELAAAAFGVKPKYRVLGKPLLRVVGWFDPRVRESYEMLYQSAAPYIFDSTKFATEFGFAGTPYADGIRIAAESYAR